MLLLKKAQALEFMKSLAHLWFVGERSIELKKVAHWVETLTIFPEELSETVNQNSLPVELRLNFL